MAVPIVNKALANYTRPDILPGGKAAIVSIPLLGVGVLSLETGEFRLLVAEAGGGRYMPGYLTFARPGKLLAVPFDLDRLVVTGPETILIDGVRTELEGAGAASEPQSVFSRDGTLVYAEGGAPGESVRPVWVSRQGMAQPLDLPPRTYRAARLSPDGRFVALIIADPRSDVWILDLEHDKLTQRTFGAEPEALNWTPDSERITFGSRRNGKRAFWLPRDGNSEPEPFVTEDGQPAFGSFSPDGKLAVTMKGGPTTGLDLWVLSLKGPQIPQPFLSTRFTEAGGTFSSDGRWIAYASDESGRYEIYVRPYPGSGSAIRVSTNGGERASWSRDGRELFYRSGQKLMSVAVTLSPKFTAASPRLLFEGPYTSIDASPDGQRFLALEPVEAQIAPLTHLNIVLNWFSDVKQRIDSASLNAPH